MKTKGKSYFKAVTTVLKSKEKSRRMKMTTDYKHGISYLSMTSVSIMKKISEEGLQRSTRRTKGNNSLERGRC